VGDMKYGDTDVNGQLMSQGLNRLFLHASDLHLTNELNEVQHFHAPLPNDLSRFLEKLREL